MAFEVEVTTNPGGGGGGGGTGGGGPIVLSGHAPWQAKRLFWQGVNGDVFDVTDYRGNGMYARTGRQGFDGPPDPEVSLEQKAQGGATLQAIRYPPLILTSPVSVGGANPDVVKARRNRFLASLRTPAEAWDGVDLTMGLLTMVHADGERRSIPASFYAGAHGDESPDKLLWTAAGFQWIAPHPHWQGATRHFHLEYVDPVPFFPLYPVRLVSETWNAVQDVEVDGDAPVTQPYVTIKGPGTPIVGNLTVGQSWTTTRALLDGETLFVDHRPRTLSPTGGTATLTDIAGNQSNAFTLLGRFPDLWPLAQGRVNSLSISLVGAGQNSTVDVAWSEQWQASW